MFRTIDRGDYYHGYFLADPATPGVIHGLKPLNPWYCGSCMKDGKQYDIYFIHWYKDYPTGSEQSQDFAEVKDFSLDAFDQWLQVPLVQAVIMDLPLSGLTVLPTVTALLDADRALGIPGEHIAYRRADIIHPAFLGFTFDSVLAENPWIVQPVVDPETGVETPNIWKCNLGTTVES